MECTKSKAKDVAKNNDNTPTTRGRKMATLDDAILRAAKSDHGIARLLLNQNSKAQKELEGSMDMWKGLL